MRQPSPALRLFPSLACLLIAPALTARAAPAAPGGVDTRDVEVVAHATSLTDVLDRVGDIAAGDDWQKEGWTDPLIEGWIAHVVATVREAGHGKDLRDPVKFAEFKGRGPRDDPRAAMLDAPGPGSIIVAKQVDETRLNNAIVLVDGDAHIPYADYCVIVARGVVDIAHGRGNVVIAGQFIDISHDNSDRQVALRMAERGRAAPPRPVAPASLLMSPGVVRVSHAGESVCAAGESLEIGHALGCVFLNTPNKTISHNQGGVELNSDKVRLGDAPKPHPLAADVKLHAPAGNMAVFWHKDRRYVAERGKPVVDETGAPVAALAGWILTVVGQDYAVLANEQERASVLMRRERR